MGSFLDKPKEEKNPESGKNNQVSWGVCEMQGWRTSQEDRYIIHELDLADGTKGMLFGVFDGHGGKEVSDYCELVFKDTLIQIDEFKSQKYKTALEKCFLKVDQKIRDEKIFVSGATANVVLMTTTQMFCANAGDSRSAMMNSKVLPHKTIALSEDHKPNNQIELQRITAAGHQVMLNRVDGSLALSRALGDLEYKDRNDLPPEQQAVSPFPDVTIRDRDENDCFMIIACDGIWDCLSNEECISKLQQKIAKIDIANVSALTKPLEEMFDENLANFIGGDNKGTDNMTAILVYFHDNIKAQKISVDTEQPEGAPEPTEAEKQIEAMISEGKDD